MATIEKGSKKAQQSPTTLNEQNTVDKLEEALAKTDLQENDGPASTDEEKVEQSPRPLHVYKRHELLFLSKSPLVKPPDDLPPLKDWFGYVPHPLHPFACSSHIDPQGLERTGGE